MQSAFKFSELMVFAGGSIADNAAFASNALDSKVRLGACVGSFQAAQKAVVVFCFVKSLSADASQVCLLTCLYLLKRRHGQKWQAGRVFQAKKLIGNLVYILPFHPILLQLYYLSLRFPNYGLWMFVDAINLR